MMEALSKWFWNEWIWLPENYTWDDVQPSPTSKVNYTYFWDLKYPVWIALALLVLRQITEKLVLERLGVKIGLRPGRLYNVQPKSTPELEEAYERIKTNKTKKLAHKDVERLAKDSGMEIRQVQRWLRWKYMQNRPTKLKKFCEVAWRFLCYGFLWVLGIIVLYDKPWLWDIRECWYKYPDHNLSNDIWWYYTASASFYWSLLLSQFSDVKRKDFWEMFAHHLTTLGLLAFSWVGNLTRLGSLMILLHDTADVFLEIGKMAKYARYERTCDVVFAIFTLIWIITRLGIYPYYIMGSTIFEATTIVKIFPIYYIFNGMLIFLLCLHIFWTYFIFKVLFTAVIKGQYEDARSSSEESTEEDKKKHS